MRIAVVVGTRPEIIKMAPIVRACIERDVPLAFIHTGQHYSFELDGLFIQELDLPQPDHNLGVGSGSPAFQIGTILTRMEPVLLDERPDVVLVEGDTNSVLGGALAANKAGVKVGHVEAGLRSHDRAMPEEINRILTDHMSDHLFAPTTVAREALLSEGVPDGSIHVTGNTVFDELLLQRPRALGTDLSRIYDVEPRLYALATVHRLANVEEPERLGGIFKGLAEVSHTLDMQVLAILHPRTTASLKRFRIRLDPAIRVLSPLGYLDFLGLHAQAALMLTDSGGLQEEACCLQIPCVTLRDTTERPETIDVGANVLAGTDPMRIVAAAVDMVRRQGGWVNPFGDGRAGWRIVDLLLSGG